VLVEHVEDDLAGVGPDDRPVMVVLKTPVVLRCTRRLKMISTLAGRPTSRLSAISASKKPRARRGASNTMVRDTSTWRIDSSRQYPQAWS
jgi:hypothetical protein